MSDQSSKPEGESAPFSAQDAMAFMQRIWNPFAMPMPGSAAGGSEARPARARRSAFAGEFCDAEHDG